ncbi:collagen-like protein [PVC group bacterium]|nr:collagen-like protein [PVC group bacterium]
MNTPITTKTSGIATFTLVTLIGACVVGGLLYKKLDHSWQSRYETLASEFESKNHAWAQRYNTLDNSFKNVNQKFKTLQQELHKRPTLDELLGSREHRKLIQDELSSGKWRIPGDIGAKGPRGNKGPTGDPGGPIGPAGPQGPRGLTGQRGQQGQPGLKGDPGGPIGPRGEQGNIGPQGVRGLRGERGFDGPQGAMGNHGQKGLDGTLPITELCIALACTILCLYMIKSIVDFQFRKCKLRQGGINFEYRRGQEL